MVRSTHKLTAALLALAMVVAACGDGSSSTSTTTGEGGGDGEKLVVYSGRNENFVNPVIEKFQARQACHTIRPDLARQVQIMDKRFWIFSDGYAILAGQARRELRILELVSTGGHELGVIRALLDWNFGDRASWGLSMWDGERIGRLMRCVSYWSGGSSAMYRINDLAQVLDAARPVLSARARGLHDFSVAIGVQEHDRTSVTTVAVVDGEVHIEPGRHTTSYVELPVVEATRLILGGPPIAPQANLPQPLLALLPVPCYVLPFDHV